MLFLDLHCVCVCTRACARGRVCVRTRVCACVCMCACVCVRACVRACVCVCVCVCVYVRILTPDNDREEHGVGSKISPGEGGIGQSYQKLRNKKTITWKFGTKAPSAPHAQYRKRFRASYNTTPSSISIMFFFFFYFFEKLKEWSRTKKRTKNEERRKLQ